MGGNLADFDFDLAESGAAAPTTPELDAASTGTLAYIGTYEADAAGRLIDHFRKPRNEAFVRASATPWQELEDALWSLVNLNLDNATGHALELIGRSIGERPAGRDDDAYRAGIRTRILVNNSQGKREELYAIVLSMLPDADGSVELHTLPPRSIMAYLTTGPAAIGYPTLALALRQAKAGGVALGLVAGESGTPLMFCDEADAADPDANGFCSDADLEGGGDAWGVY